MTQEVRKFEKVVDGARSARSIVGAGRDALPVNKNEDLNMEMLAFCPMTRDVVGVVHIGPWPKPVGIFHDWKVYVSYKGWCHVILFNEVS